MTTATENVLIETGELEAEYGYTCTVAVIDHHEHGRLLLMQGFGGMDSVEGGAVRWRHGMAVKIHDDDTLDGLGSERWNAETTLYQAVVNGHDNSRPVMEWDGFVVERIASTVGL